MLLSRRAMWECAQCGRALTPGDKACPRCGSIEARRRPVPPRSPLNWSMVAVVGFIIALGAIAFLVASHFAPQPPPSGETVRHFRRGQELLDARRYQEAIPELEAVTRLAPTSIAGHHELARAYNGVGRYAEALREMRLTVRLAMTDEAASTETRYADEADLRYDLATLLAKNGEFGEAVTELGKAARVDPALERTPEYHIALGIAQAGRGRTEAAEEALARAAEMTPQITTKALKDWIADRPEGPEAPVLGRAISQLQAPAAPPAEASEAPPPDETTTAPQTSSPDAHTPP